MAIGLAYLGFFVLLQWSSGAHAAGFGGDPDEPAHYVTGLMVRDYVAALLPTAPLPYAENYYVHYPEVAFGHWPPLFHLIEAGWMLVFPVSHSSLMALMATLSALCGLALYLLARQAVNEGWALVAGFVFLALPVTLTYGSLTMTDIPLALLSTVALFLLIRLLTEDTWRMAIGFGIAAAATALVKPSGWALLMVPVPAALMINATRRLSSRRLWLGMSLALLLAAPVHVLTLKFQREGLEGRDITLHGVGQNLMTYFEETPDLLGWAVLFLFMIGIAASFYALRARPGSVHSAVMLTYLCSVVLFHAVVPTVPDMRKLFMAVPVFVLIAVSGLRWIADRLPERPPASSAVPAVLGAILLIPPMWSDLAKPRRERTGFESVAEFLLSRPELSSRVTLVSVLNRETSKEGALVAEIAARDPHRPSHFVLRASKQLMHSTWNRLNYTSFFSGADQMQAALLKIPVGLIVTEGKPGELAMMPHQRVLAEMLNRHGSEWKSVYNVVGSSGERIEVFASTHELGSQPLDIEVDLRDKLNQVIRNTR